MWSEDAKHLPSARVGRAYGRRTLTPCPGHESTTSFHFTPPRQQANFGVCSQAVRIRSVSRALFRSGGSAKLVRVEAGWGRTRKPRTMRLPWFDHARLFPRLFIPRLDLTPLVSGTQLV